MKFSLAKRLNDKKQVFEDKIKDIKNRIKSTNICCICYDETIENKSLVKCCSNTFCFDKISLFFNIWFHKKYFEFAYLLNF